MPHAINEHAGPQVTAATGPEGPWATRVHKTRIGAMIANDPTLSADTALSCPAGHFAALPASALITAANLQKVIDPAHAADFHRQLLGTGFLFRRLNYPVQ